MALVLKTLQFNDVISKVFDKTGILQKETKLNENLAAVLVAELVWGKKVLESESKPVQTILKHYEQLVSTATSEEFSKTEDITATG